VTAEMPIAAKSPGQTAKTTQSFRGKKFTFGPMKVGEDKGVDSWRYVTHPCQSTLWPACQERRVVYPNFQSMEDNVPSHNSDFTNREQAKENIPKVAWPANSPDFNPIEHLWCLMKSRILRWRGEEEITTPTKMKAVLQKEWGKITVDEINNEISKLPLIMGQCMLQDGGNKFDA